MQIYTQSLLLILDSRLLELETMLLELKTMLLELKTKLLEPLDKHDEPSEIKHELLDLPDMKIALDSLRQSDSYNVLDMLFITTYKYTSSIIPLV